MNHGVMNNFLPPNYPPFVGQPIQGTFRYPYSALPSHPQGGSILGPSVDSNSVKRLDVSNTNLRPTYFAVQNNGTQLHHGTIQSDKKLLCQLHNLLEQLKQQKKMLLEYLDAEDGDWHREVSKICHTKKQVADIQEKFNSEYIRKARQRLKARKKQRLRKQKKKRDEYQEAAEKRRVKNEAIDEVMAAERNKKEQKEKDAELQKEIDGTLSEVRKKKRDMSQYHALHRTLRKLRVLRQQRASALDTHLEREKFEKQITALEEFVQKRSTMYREEEKTMQVMLEGEHNELRAKEDEALLKKKARINEEKLKLHIENLFGEDFLHCSRNDQHLETFYFQAERDLQSFFNIRQQWDVFLVDKNNPEGSGIPLKWVSPAPPSSEMWVCALEKGKEIPSS